MGSGEFIFSRTDDGRDEIQFRTEGEAVWLTQLEITTLFDTTRRNVSLRLRNIFREGELLDSSAVKEPLTAAADGKRYQTKLFNLDAILAVGCRIPR